jgi:hypothetical protein
MNKIILALCVALIVLSASVIVKNGRRFYNREGYIKGCEETSISVFEYYDLSDEEKAAITKYCEEHAKEAYK